MNAPMVKIGFTRGPIAKRLRSLKTGAPAPLVLLREIEGTDTLERDLHERWRGYRASGEWFHNAGPVAKWIKEGCPV